MSPLIRRFQFPLVGLLLLVAALSPAQWNLDLDRAMDAIGVAPGMVVGEAGAGDGYFTLPMARRVGPEGIVVANDISRKPLRTLEQRSKEQGLSNIQTVVGESADPLFPRRDLQLVVVVHAFHEFDQPVVWLVNLKKYLRPGGALAIIDRDPDRGASSHFWPKDRILRHADEAGYELTRSFEDFPEHLVMVFRLRTSP
ncbi:MAG: class I SAM-dependent methyltransferase [Acidobacteria bacterium]|nr:MAG: class I SAM-dependent methyltransferase [Acidobacteriota bacterium]RPJ75132.1 MAG: class I SAM-dependent methyltransferase [Acidobacteriota bacterium]